MNTKKLNLFGSRGFKDDIMTIGLIALGLWATLFYRGRFYAEYLIYD